MSHVLGSTDLIREQLRSWEGRFTARDLKLCRSLHSVLNRLERLGEIRDTGETLPSLRKCTRPSKIYEVIRIRTVAEVVRPRRSSRTGKRHTPKQYKEAISTLCAAWADIYPDLFHVHPVLHECRKVTFATHTDFID